MSTAPPKPLKKTGFSFSEDSDEEFLEKSDDKGRVNRLLVQKNAQAEREASKAHTDTLSEDPSAFDYDGVYDSFKAIEEKKVASHSLSQSNTKESAPVSTAEYHMYISMNVSYM